VLNVRELAILLFNRFRISHGYTLFVHVEMYIY
jgi:hypothetical protein